MAVGLDEKAVDGSKSFNNRRQALYRGTSGNGAGRIQGNGELVQELDFYRVVDVAVKCPRWEAVRHSRSSCERFVKLMVLISTANRDQQYQNIIECPTLTKRHT